MTRVIKQVSKSIEHCQKGAKLTVLQSCREGKLGGMAIWPKRNWTVESNETRFWEPSVTGRMVWKRKEEKRGKRSIFSNCQTTNLISSLHLSLEVKVKVIAYTHFFPKQASFYVWHILAVNMIVLKRKVPHIVESNIAEQLYHEELIQRIKVGCFKCCCFANHVVKYMMSVTD